MDFLLAQGLTPEMVSWTPTSVGGLVTVVMGAIVTVIGAWKMAKIEAHVNSEKTSMHEQSVAKDREIVLLREMLQDRKQSAALLAQAASHAQGSAQGSRVVRAGDAAPLSQEVTDSLKAIDKNTAAIDVNTQKTVETVEAIADQAAQAAAALTNKVAQA